MVSHDRAIEIIRDNIDRDQRIPDEMSYIIHEADAEGRDANVSLPAIEMQISRVDNDDQNNSTFDGYVYDSDGNEVGRLYETKWEMDLFLYLWTVQGSDYDVQRLGETVKTVLYDHDELGPGLPFTNDDGEAVDDIWGFHIEGSERDDDFGQTPTIRRLRIETLVRGANRYRALGEGPIQTTDSQAVGPVPDDG